MTDDDLTDLRGPFKPLPRKLTNPDDLPDDPDSHSPLTSGPRW